MGSGTTAIAAKKLGRNYIGSEISQEYCAIAASRI
jgi:DNA modification methylase